MATETAERGIKSCKCPMCGADDALSVRLSDGAICCVDCDAEMTAEELEAMARSWLKLAAWVKLLPAMTFGEE